MEWRRNGDLYIHETVNPVHWKPITENGYVTDNCLDNM